MNRLLVWKIAVRYLVGKRSANAVPVLSRVSMIAITVGSAAMVVVFSVFNGFDGLVKDSYRSFYPDLRITPAKGKFFSDKAIDIKKLAATNGIVAVAPVIEDNVLAAEASEIGESNNAQIVVTLKGIDRHYLDVNHIRPFISGADSVSAGADMTAIIGLHNARMLGVDVKNDFSKIAVYYPNPTLKNPESDPENAFEELKLHPVGAFHITEEFESKYMMAPISLAQHLFHRDSMYSSIELSVTPGMDEQLKQVLQHQYGNSFKVETRYEQNKTLFVVIGTEKWAVYFILLLVISVASFNMVGALGMLVMEKRKDIAIITAMGAEKGLIRSIFLLEGILWSVTGGITGVLAGCLICFVQQKFELIKLSGDFLVDAYPVKVEPTDLILVLGTIIFVGFCAAWQPARRAIAGSDPSLKSA